MNPSPREPFIAAVRADMWRYVGATSLRSVSSCRLLIESYGFQATLSYRFGRLLARLTKSPAIIVALPLWPVYWLASLFVRRCYGIHLKLSAQIGPGLYIGHFGNIIVERCSLGENCSIAQQTMISGPPAGRGPQIGSRVWIGAHTRVIGAIRVGDGATIGAGCHVVADVPASALVMGNPARCMSTAYDNSSFLFPTQNEPISPIQAP